MVYLLFSHPTCSCWWNEKVLSFMNAHLVVTVEVGHNWYFTTTHLELSFQCRITTMFKSRCIHQSLQILNTPFCQHLVYDRLHPFWVVPFCSRTCSVTKWLLFSLFVLPWPLKGQHDCAGISPHRGCAPLASQNHPP